MSEPEPEEPSPKFAAIVFVLGIGLLVLAGMVFVVVTVIRTL